VRIHQFWALMDARVSRVRIAAAAPQEVLPAERQWQQDRDVDVNDVSSGADLLYRQC
jgi:hypothetical protein